MDLEKIKKDWIKYEKAFGEEEYMDIDEHTSMSFEVPQLIAEIEKLKIQLDAKLTVINNGWEEERYALQNKVEYYESALNEIKAKTLDSSYAYEIAHSALYKHQE